MQQIILIIKKLCHKCFYSSLSCLMAAGKMMFSGWTRTGNSFIAQRVYFVALDTLH